MTTPTLTALPMSAYPAEDQAFYIWWYGHMKDEQMTGPLQNVDHSTARYIWNAALAAAQPDMHTCPRCERKWKHMAEDAPLVQAHKQLAAPVAAQDLKECLSPINTMAGFKGGFAALHKRNPTEQEIWNAGVRSGLDRQQSAPAQGEPDDKDKRIAELQSELAAVKARLYVSTQSDSIYDRIMPR